MHTLNKLLPFSGIRPPAVVVLEGVSGSARQRCLHDWLDQAQRQGALTWLVSCDFDRHGSWAGLRELLIGVIPEIKKAAPELIAKHAYELCIVVPELRRELMVRNATLTDTAIDEEKVRSYPRERSYRIVDGIIDLLSEWHDRLPRRQWVVACDSFDKAGSLVQRFFVQLLQRRGQPFELTLLLATDLHAGEDTTAGLPASVTVLEPIRLDLPPDPPESLSVEEAARLAMELEHRMAGDPIEAAIGFPGLVWYWSRTDRVDKLVKSLIIAHGLTNHAGLYEDALRYGHALSGHLERLSREDLPLYWAAVNNLLNSYAGTRDASQAINLALEAESHIDDPKALIELYYMLAMFYARYQDKPDFAKAEEYLNRGIEQIERSNLSPPEKHFRHVFNRNGLAFVYFRQGKVEAAVQLCIEGLARLNEHLRPEQHKLHRSVLIYNIGQVYAAVGKYDDAIVHYNSAIEMDPNYSDYYNDRGSLYMVLGKMDSALTDFYKAVESSPPYAEVWLNIGQCHRSMGNMVKAVAAYSVALDLDPTRTLALLGRAQAYEALGQVDEAIVDYTGALTLDPEQPQALANRAVLYYSSGNTEGAANDLDRAIALAPQMADLYQNRAVALFNLDRKDEAIRDLQTYLRLVPHAEDIKEVEAMLAANLAPAHYSASNPA